MSLDKEKTTPEEAALWDSVGTLCSLANTAGMPADDVISVLANYLGALVMKNHGPSGMKTIHEIMDQIEKDGLN